MKPVERLAPLRVFALALALACGSAKPAAYVNERALAEKARDAGNHALAGEHYERAAERSGSAKDAEETRYLAADSYERAGDTTRAQQLYRLLSVGGPSGDRQARADLSLARLELRAGNEAEGQRLLAAAIRRHPGSALSKRAVGDHVAYLRAKGGTEQALDYLRSAQRELAASELSETLHYLLGRELDAAGRAAEARDAYLSCAARFPYPKGVYWDDALYRAAEAEQRLGAPERALVHLERLLAEQETASITGSYERARYAEAQLKVAEIYRDALHDSARARRELRKVWERHPTSRLVDDALFEEALLARAAGDLSGTCAPLSILIEERRDSRYAPCAHALCGELAELPGRACHDYVKRRAGLP